MLGARKQGEKRAEERRGCIAALKGRSKKKRGRIIKVEAVEESQLTKGQSRGRSKG